MSKIALSSNPSGTGTLTIAAPNTNVDRTLTLPDEAGTVLVNGTNQNVGIGTSSPLARLQVSTGGTSTTPNTNMVARFVTNGSDADSHIQFSNGVDHSANIGIAGGANLYFSTDGTERMRIDGDGRVFAPNQARCVVTQSGGWRTLTAGTSYGVSNSGFPVNNGGFYNGGQINGFNVVHVPVSGWYRFDMYVYSGNGNPAGARIILMKNNAEEIVFVQTPSTTDSTTFISRMFYMTANDYVNYKVAPPGFPDFTAYFADNHTMLAISLEG